MTKCAIKIKNLVGIKPELLYIISSRNPNYYNKNKNISELLTANISVYMQMFYFTIQTIIVDKNKRTKADIYISHKTPNKGSLIRAEFKFEYFDMAF